MIEFAETAFRDRTDRPDAYCPLELYDVWLCLNSIIVMTGFSQEPLPLGDLLTCCRKIGVDPTASEIELLQQLHFRYRRAMATPQRKPLKEATPTDVDAAKAVFGLKGNVKKSNG